MSGRANIESEAPSQPSFEEQAERLRRVDVAMEDVQVVMDSATMLEQAGEDLSALRKNRDRLMRNRNNKQAEVTELRGKVAAALEYIDGLDPAPRRTEIPQRVRDILTS